MIRTRRTKRIPRIEIIILIMGGVGGGYAEEEERKRAYIICGYVCVCVRVGISAIMIMR